MNRILLLILILWSILPLSGSAQCPAGTDEVVVVIQPDSYPNEISWTLKDISGNPLGWGTFNGDTLCVPSGICLIFEIKDSYGDGICCAFGNGFYAVYVNGSIQAAGGQYTYNEVSYLNCPSGSHCGNAFTAFEDTVYTATGTSTWYEFTPDSTGTYNISTCFPSNTCDTRLWVYDHCTNLVWNSTMAGTLFYNDSTCGNQAFIPAGLQGGMTYYVRVGGDATCSGSSIDWQISYTGPVVGCTDPAACNYNPLAIISNGSCIYPGDPNCSSGPDLLVDGNALSTSLSLSVVNGNDPCLIGEGCLTGYGPRNVINFSTRIANIGDADYYIGQPQTGNQFVFDQCHGHWHYAGYARYDLYDSLGIPMQAGFKNGFCVMDLQCFGGMAKYGCSDMGISAACADIYGAGLACQWIDVTNVPAGRYTLVVRVNWDESPDKVGRVEQRFNNNAAGVCVDITRDSLNNPSFTQIMSCPPFIDCAGDTFGLAIQDCMGDCNGTRITGDIDVDYDRDATDVLEYMSDVVTQQSVVPCNDVNGDGGLTVTDAALVNSCVRFNAGAHTHPGGTQNTHRHCEFPFNLININDTVYLSMGQVNASSQSIDIDLRNPNGRLMGVDFSMSGLVIDSVVSLIPGFQPTIRWDASTGRIAILDTTGASLPKNVTSLPFLRVYYSSLLSNTVCVAAFHAAVNGNDEETILQIQGGCVTLTGVNILYQSGMVKLHPNPTSGFFRLTTDVLNGEEAEITVTDAMGRVVFRTSRVLDANGVDFDLSASPAGVYLVRVHTTQLDATNRIVRW
jgi:hypothetical protein